MQKTIKKFYRYDRYLVLQLLAFNLGAVAFFYLVKWFGQYLDASHFVIKSADSIFNFREFILNFVIKSADNIFNFREFILNLVFRVIPILIPILIATASLLLNKYTSIYLSILLGDKSIRRLLLFCCCFFIFHALVILYTPSETWTDSNKYYINFYHFFFLDSLFSTVLLIFSIYTITQVFFYSQPAKLSISFSSSINNTTSQINKLLFSAVSKEKEVSHRTVILKRYISNFTNLIVLAVKSKDNETIRESIHRLGFEIWTLMLEQVNFDEKSKRKQIFNEFYVDFRGFAGQVKYSQQKHILSLTNKRMDSIVDETNLAYNTAGEQIAQVYKDVFETAFSSKEFYACDFILDSLQDKAKKDRIVNKRVLLILADLFETAIFYKHNGYTHQYCERIIEITEGIYAYYVNTTHPLQELEVYYLFMKKAIYHKEPQIFKLILKSLRTILRLYEGQEENEKAYKNILYAGMYCLEIKSMKCFATLIRYLVTEKYDLNEVNNSFAKMNYVVKQKPVNLQDNDFISLLDSYQQNFQEENIFNITKEKKYLFLKFYVVFYSYYKLQLDVSPDRIDEKNYDLAICDDLFGNFPFLVIRTVLLDLETHSKKWNELFIEHCKEYFTETAKSLMDGTDFVDSGKHDRFKESSEFLKVLHEKVYIAPVPM